MDVWFCVLRRNPIQKRFENKLSKLPTNAPSERVQGFVAFPLTLLIMDVRDADFHDKSLSSGAGISRGAQESAWCSFPQPVHRLAVKPLGAVPAYNAEPDIHSLYRVVLQPSQKIE